MPAQNSTPTYPYYELSNGNVIIHFPYEKFCWLGLPDLHSVRSLLTAELLTEDAVSDEFGLSEGHRDHELIHKIEIINYFIDNHVQPNQ